jgi:hypothetical protein
MKKDYIAFFKSRGERILATAFGIGILLLWLWVQNADYNDCIRTGFGC